MKKMRLSLSFPFFVLAIMAMIVTPGCKGKESPPAQAEEITLQSFATVLGNAGADESGIAALDKTDEGLVVTYHLYLPEAQDFDVLIGQDLAPKIEKLYKTFNSIDQVTFDVRTPDLAGTGEYRQYCAFDMTRKTFNELDWTNLLAADLFKVCKVKYAEE